MMKSKNYQSQMTIIFWWILCLALLTRLWNLQNLPLGLDQDEAFAGYEAFNLLHTSKDSWLYRFPMYFTAWGSGMNALYSYLTIPLMALLGMDIWVIRLPQAILGVLSCYIFYRLISLIYDKKAGLVGFFMITICPWHIMLSRWGLESNLVVFFMLCGFYFFARGIKRIRYLYISALFYGLGLYAYAVCVPFIVLMFGLQLLYVCVYQHNWQSFKHILGAGLFFGLIAIPMLLFFMVNQEMIPEIRTDYFSVPKLLYWRNGEVGFNDFNLKATVLKHVLIDGDDYLISNRIPTFGIFYPFSIVLIGVGILLILKRTIKELKSKQFSLSCCILVQIIFGVLYGAMLYPCINRLNFLWINLLIALVVGIIYLPRYIRWSILGAYIVGFCCFSYTYITKYNALAKNNFTPDLRQALSVAEDYHNKTGLPIVILEQTAIFPKILFYTQMPNNEFMQSVIWKNYPAQYLDARSLGHYAFAEHWDYVHIPTQAIYIVPKENIYYFYEFAMKQVGELGVAIPRQIYTK